MPDRYLHTGVYLISKLLAKRELLGGGLASGK
jgi:hypothetical protein